MRVSHRDRPPGRSLWALADMVTVGRIILEFL